MFLGFLGLLSDQQTCKQLQLSEPPGLGIEGTGGLRVGEAGHAAFGLWPQKPPSKAHSQI